MQEAESERLGQPGEHRSEERSPVVVDGGGAFIPSTEQAEERQVELRDFEASLVYKPGQLGYTGKKKWEKQYKTEKKGKRGKWFTSDSFRCF